MPSKENHYFTKLGTFNISPGFKVVGELCWSGENSYLYIGDVNYFDVSTSKSCITGYLHDLNKVTLIDCIFTEGTGSASNSLGEKFYYARLFPHYIITGKSYFSTLDENINEISFVIDDASALFNDFRAFNSKFGDVNLISEIVKAHKLPYEVDIGENPIVTYFTGKSEIIRLDTTLGEIIARHNPSFGMGGPDGVHINNSITVTIRPNSPIAFKEATNRILDLLGFFQIVIGRMQKLAQVKIRTCDDNSNNPNILNVYWSLSPAHSRTATQDKQEPHSFDVLVDPIRNPEEFKNVLIKWLALKDQRRSARVRFSSSFEKGNEYDIDRLVGAANMFDILPDSALPIKSDLSPELLNAKKECNSIFASLPSSSERDGFLNALGRVGTNTLKQKIRYRAEYITKTSGDDFADLNLVIDEAVKCRNYFVHGSNSKLNYNNSNLLSFFIDTLEFVFATSELIECGWSMQAWRIKGTTMSHPFGRYRVGYSQNLAQLKQLLAAS